MHSTAFIKLLPFVADPIEWKMIFFLSIFDPVIVGGIQHFEDAKKKIASFILNPI